jgi:phage shock protein PspC (stress-responsive transcriptional regulator)
MNKIIQINLAGQAVSIDEKAYQSLSHYLQTLENHFANTVDGREILTDIEARIAELFFGKIRRGNAFINENDVSEAIQLMGTAEDMDIDQDPETQHRQKETNTSSKKLYRDTDDRVLGGVCSGLAAYFGMDTSVVRIIAVLIILFTGIPLIAYFVLWAILPEANTPEDRSRMKGGNTTINDIVNSVRQEATDVARNVKNEANNVADNLKKNSNFSNSAKSVTSGIEQIIAFFAKIFGAGVLIFLVTTGIALTVFLIANATGGFHFNTVNGDILTPSLLKSPTLNWLFSLSLLSLILIPIGTICYAIILFIFNSTVLINVKAVFLSWLVCLALFTGISIYSVGNINKESLQEFGEKMKRKSKYDIDIKIKQIPPIAPIQSVDTSLSNNEELIFSDSIRIN